MKRPCLLLVLGVLANAFALTAPALAASPGDMCIVEDPDNGAIVSATPSGDQPDADAVGGFCNDAVSQGAEALPSTGLPAGQAEVCNAAYPGYVVQVYAHDDSSTQWAQGFCGSLDNPNYD